jgi:exosortase/archaeosortase family protein
MRNLLQKVNGIIVKYRLSALREVFIFCLITIIVHFSYRFWAINLDYKPITSIIIAVQTFLAEQVISSSIWFLEEILKVNVSHINDRIYLDNNGWVGVGIGCSAFKPMLQFVILMFFFPGPFIRKLWFVPSGLVLIHITNNFRIISLSLITHNSCSQEFWDFSHDYILRPLFYAVIFTLWVLWVEIISKKKQ